MFIRPISHNDVQDFIYCFITVFSTLQEILPQDFVLSHIEEASTHDFQQNLVSQVDDPTSILLVATENEKIIGLAWGTVKENQLGWLSFLGVLHAHRRMGIGKTLLRRFIEECIDRGAHKMSLDTDPRLIPAITLYESMGFRREGVVENPHGMKLILFSKELASL